MGFRSSMPEANPYETPKTDCSGATEPEVPNSTARIVKETVQLLGIGMLLGALLGMLACVVLSGGRAAYMFYPIYGAFGAVVGVFGSAFGGVIIALLRWLTRITNRR